MRRSGVSQKVVIMLLSPVQVYVFAFLFSQLTLVKWPAFTSEQFDGPTNFDRAQRHNTS